MIYNDKGSLKYYLIYLVVKLDDIWLLKVSYLSKIRPRCFWLTLLCALLPLHIKRGLFVFVPLLENSTSWACFKGSGLNDILHLYGHWEILVRSITKISADVWGSLATWNIDVLSTKCFTVDFVFNFAIWWLQNLLRIFILAISIKIRNKSYILYQFFYC